MHWPVFLVFICLVKLTFECFNKIRNGRLTETTWTDADLFNSTLQNIGFIWKLRRFSIGPPHQCSPLGQKLVSIRNNQYFQWLLRVILKKFGTCSLQMFPQFCSFWLP